MRYASIDVLRTLAIVLMVIVHFSENLAGVPWAPAGFGAPMFGFLVGVSYCIWLRQRYRRGDSDAQITRASVKRGLFIFALGLLFNVAVWTPGDLFNWDVLTLLGTAMVLLAMVREQPPVVPLAIAVIVFLIAPVLSHQADYYAYWQDGYFDPDWTFSEIAMGYFVTGYFPLFPWLMFPLIGYAVGGKLLPETATASSSAPQLSQVLTFRRVMPFAVAGAACLLLQALIYFTRARHTGLTAHYFRRWTMFPASVEYVLSVLGTVLLLFSLGLWLIDGRRLFDRVPGVLAATRTLSQHSLSLYVLHHVLHLWPLWIYTVWQGLEVTALWRKALPWSWAMGLAGVCVAVLFLIARFIMEPRKLSFENLMRRLCDPRTPRQDDDARENTATARR
jgi:uncharacterized membrane protein